MTPEYEKAIDGMKDKWPSNWVARKEIGVFSGGILSPKTMANLDSAGEGPEGRFILKSQAAYLIEPLCDWFKIHASKSWKTRKAKS